MTPWRPLVEIYVDGERFDANNANRPIEQLAAQTQHLKERILALDPNAGKVMFTNVPVDGSVSVGDFVYFDENNAVFTPALAEAEIDPSTGTYQASSSSFVVGMVVSKSSATIADIVQTGRIVLSDYGIDPNDLVEDPVLDPFIPGRYYLSRKVPGKISRHPSSPTVQLGYFTEKDFFVFPNQREVADTHYHHHFTLKAKPSASQDFARKGWCWYGTEIQRVNYFHNGNDDSACDILLCVRPNGNPPATDSEATRVDIYKTLDSKLGVTLVRGAGLDYADSTSSGDDDALLEAVDWPAYGEWISIPDTNLDIAFIRRDGVYTSTLADDADALLLTGSYQWKVYLPDDLTGWTNANPFDPMTPSGVLYRYLHESQVDLNASFPPVPAESAFLQLNGTALQNGVDFKITTFGIFWIPGDFSDDYNSSPWPKDYTTGPDEMDPANARNLQIHFTTSALGNANSVVMSLVGIPPIKVTRCPTGESASTGNLQISIDLGLLVSDQPPINSATALVGVNGTSFTLGNHVAGVLPGPGIDVAAVNGQPGVVRVSRMDAKFEAEIGDIALRNAKEVVAPTHSFISFPMPSHAPSGITANFKLPNRDYDTANLKLDLFAKMFGEASVSAGAETRRAIFKVAYHVVRPGFPLSALSAANAVVVQHWSVLFGAGYVGSTLLAQEQPEGAGFQVNKDTLIARPFSLVAQNGGFKAGDLVVLQIDRVKTNPINQSDDYNGRVGLIGLRWILS